MLNTRSRQSKLLRACLLLGMIRELLSIHHISEALRLFVTSASGDGASQVANSGDNGCSPASGGLRKRGKNRRERSVEHQRLGNWPMAAVKDTGGGIRVSIGPLQDLGTTQPGATGGLPSVETPDAGSASRAIWEGKATRLLPPPISL